MYVPSEVLRAIENVWAMPSLQSIELRKTPEVLELDAVCERVYAQGKGGYALANALRSLGVPCMLPPDAKELCLHPAKAAERLHDAYLRKTVLRRHLCPLEYADHLPEVVFGTSRAGQFTSAELGEFMDAKRLRRYFPGYRLALRDYAKFRWLVVEEEVIVKAPPLQRALPFLSMDFSRDLGEINPHLGRFPQAVEVALFFLLLAPWEEWVRYQQAGWRGFRLPWIYSLDDDLFVGPTVPQSPTTLATEPEYDHWDNETGDERAIIIPLDDGYESQWLQFVGETWSAFEKARTTALFETPVGHFLVRAFLADDIDEIMAHMTTIEAGLGTISDHKRKLRPKPDPHKDVSSTDRVAARLAALLRDPSCVADYQELFDLRSTFVHGRGGIAPISTQQRIRARSLARLVARRLVDDAASLSGTREAKLDQLLDAGVPFLP
ncbi:MULTISPECIES: hypothetical protein [unclassified Ensifer]|uniref:hypothetical protein n=1 Tax=unclassified Ensifer TaxID=2633371 RepID=UPI0007163EB7|nr:MULTISPECIES: hypothetical protein [unclassified Ensifer]KQX43207.1 hypothetical protein ASD49_11140 [Ensifer sp. Root1298]KQX72756.1 hypothetical protein ASD41_11640 [Ensifer sp. Root1312]KRC15722.1 hypothetical protein ASE29_11195 [Ensifer sp. Root74]KRD58997.1 hypothetical protein ASE71_09270 [Ensifer sp. Root954]